MAWHRPSGRSGVLSPTRERTVGPGAGPEARPPSAGVIGARRQGWPRGRAVLGGLLVAAAAVIVFAGALASTRGGTAGYAVASRALGPGAVIGPGDTTTETFRLPAGTRDRAFRDGASLIGRSLAVPVAPGELIEAGMLTPPAGQAPQRPVSIEVDSTSLAGLEAGEPVDVLSVPSDPSGTAGGGAASSGAAGASGAGASGAAGASGGAGAGVGVAVVVRGAELLSISRGGSALAPVASTFTVVTLGVSDLDEAEMLVAAEHAGTVELLRAEPSDGTGPGPTGSG